MNVGYIIRRIGVFLIIVWLAATINFLMPRLAPVNPIREVLLQALRFGGSGKADMEAVVKNYEAKFGLDQPIGANICVIWATLCALTLVFRSPTSPPR